MKPLSRELLVSFVLLAVIAALLAWYSIAQHPLGDIVLAKMAAQAMARELEILLTPTGGTHRISELVRLDDEVTVFLGSDGAQRLPKVALPMGRADIAIDGAVELMLLADRELVDPTLAEAPATAFALETFPEASSLLDGTGRAAVVDNRDSRASKELLNIAFREFQAIADELGGAR